MKKLFSLLTICLMLFTLSLPVYAYEEVNVNIKNVQTTEIDIIFKKGDLSKNFLNSLSDEIKIMESDDNILLRITVSNANIQEEFKEDFDVLIQALEQYHPEIANELKSKNINLESSFYGYPFGGRTSIYLTGENFDKNINIFMDGTFSYNNSEYVSEAQITPSDIPLSLEYGTTTADSLEIRIEPQNNYKTVHVTYAIKTSSGRMKDMSAEAYAKEGFNVVSQSSDNIVIEESYSDLGGFNNLFNLNLGRYFNVIGNLQIDSQKSLTKSMTVTGKFVESESIDNVILKIIMPEEATDSVSMYTGDIFTYDVTGNAEINIEFSKINTSTLLILTIVPICIIFVVASLIMLNKRGGHIRIK